MKNVLTAILVIVLLAIPLAAMAADSHKEEGHPCFSEIDADANGSATMAEMSNVYPKINDDVFARMDADKDGAVSHEEYENAMDQGIKPAQ